MPRIEQIADVVEYCVQGRALRPGSPWVTWNRPKEDRAVSERVLAELETAEQLQRAHPNPLPSRQDMEFRIARRVVHRRATPWEESVDA